jgi:hypothetical protein
MTDIHLTAVIQQFTNLLDLAATHQNFLESSRLFDEEIDYSRISAQSLGYSMKSFSW